MIHFSQHIAEILILIYFSITFGYSVFEKLYQWNDTVVYYQDHFKETVLKNRIPLLITLVIFFELISIILCITGIYFLGFYNVKLYALAGLILAAVTLTGLMFGQRIAKDYPGAMNITVYFILSIIGIYLLQ